MGHWWECHLLSQSLKGEKRKQASLTKGNNVAPCPEQKDLEGRDWWFLPILITDILFLSLDSPSKGRACCYRIKNGKKHDLVFLKVTSPRPLTATVPPPGLLTLSPAEERTLTAARDGVMSTLAASCCKGRRGAAVGVLHGVSLGVPGGTKESEVPGVLFGLRVFLLVEF